jgi:hypothetical protein
MRKMYVLTIVPALLVVGALAQSDSDYQSWMKSNPVNLASLNKNIVAKDSAAAASDAAKAGGYVQTGRGFLEEARRRG